MDDVDIDQIVEVPDTPDRLMARSIYDRGCIGMENNSYKANHSEKFEVLDEVLNSRPMDSNKLITDRGRRKLLVRPGNDFFKSDNSESNNNFRLSTSGNPASSRNAQTSNKNIVDVNLEDKHCVIHPESMGKGKGLAASYSQNSACEGQDSVVDLTKHSGHSKICKKVVPGNSETEECRKAVPAKSFSSFHIAENSHSVYNNACRGKIVDTNKVDAVSENVKKIAFVADCQTDLKNTRPISSNPNNLHRISGQKRLVLNGCISPLNVAKAKRAQEHKNPYLRSERDDSGTIKRSIAEAKDSHRDKGKEVLTHIFSSKESETKTMPFSTSSSTLNGNVYGTSDANVHSFECCEEIGGWRSTRNRTASTPLSDEGLLLPCRKDNPCKVNEPLRNGALRRAYKEGSNAKNSNDHIRQQLGSSESVSHLNHQGGQSDEYQTAARKVIKRQKQGSSWSHRGESSSSASPNSELVLIGSSQELANIRSTRMQNIQNGCSSKHVIEIDELSPEIRNGGSSRSSIRNVDSDIRARQLEADEILARELQEQLYNEVPGVGGHEIDEYVALALQQEERSQRTFPSGIHRVSHPRSSSNLNRQTQSRSQNPSSRRGTQARVSNSTRMARWRGRLPGQPRTISSRQRSSLFPPNMDVDMRIHILETLEAFSDIADVGMAGGLLQAQRDFNENDYEMLLALDENNHQHGGASVAQINGLPESTVQSDNLEDCSICLETPSIGDTIRHLPCLHRFHKDCIDPWLRRRTSCPVCKSSIT